MNRKLRELVVLLKDDPRRAGILSVMLVVLSVMVVRAMWFRGPVRASGAVKPASAETSSQAVAKGAGLKAAVEKRRRGPIVSLKAPPIELPDIFALNEKVFPATAKPQPGQRVAPKSAPIIAEDPVQTAHRLRAELEARVMKEASALKLRGTLLGASPTAVMESPLEKRPIVLTPGQEIAGFTLVDITPTGVVLEKEGIRVDVQRDGQAR